MANLTGKKFGGRKKGTPNKVTDKVRSQFEKLLSKNLNTLQDDIEALEPKDRIKVMLELAKFVVPQIKAFEVDFNDTTQEVKPIEIKIIEPLCKDGDEII